MIPMKTSLINGLLLGLAACLCAPVLFAQGEAEAPLPWNPELVRKRAQPISAQQTQRTTDVVLELPFFDDFSRFSQPTSDPDVPAEWLRWCDNHAFINNGFGVQPPTIGVATLDGLMADGYPWDWSADNTFGAADTLTSLPIDITGFTVADNIYLSFFYQGGGWGNTPDNNDRLVVELFADVGGDGTWIEVWSQDGQDAPSAFERAYINVGDTEFGNTMFTDGFQFRFRSEGTLSGAFDMWNIDYVEVRQNVNPEDDPLQELAFMYPGVTLLRDYTAMPWDHFKENPEFFMDPDTVLTYQQNLGPTVNFVTGYNVTGPDQEWSFPNAFANTSGNGFSIIRTEMSVQGTGGQVSTSNDFVYATNQPEEADTCAVFHVEYFHDATDQTPQNDTASFVQNFTNYYAYDDGTAERAYVVNPAGNIGAKLAMRYQIQKDDELLGLFIHFLPYGDFSFEENFILRAWTDGGGIPGDEIGGNFTFQTPQYVPTGHNAMSYYEYEEPIPVSEGALYVGFSKLSNVPLNIANDKSGLNKNPEQLYFQVADGTDWIQSGISGSLMIRPVFRSGKSGVIWNTIDEQAAAPVQLYPNPVADVLTFDPGLYLDTYDVRIHSLTGQEVAALAAQRGKSTFDATQLAAGAYIVTVTDLNGRVMARETVIKP